MSDLTVLEICGQVNYEEHTQRELPKWIEMQNSENQITTEPRNTSILTQEDKTTIELIIKIMSE